MTVEALLIKRRKPGLMTEKGHGVKSPLHPTFPANAGTQMEERLGVRQER